MKFRGALVAILILAGLVAYLFLVEFPGQKAKKEREKEEKSVFSLVRDDVARVALKRLEGESLEFERLDAEAPEARDKLWEWRLKNPLETYADKVRVEDLLRELEDLRKQHDLESVDFAQFGLANPEVRVEIEMRDGRSLGLSVGADAPVEAAAYARADHQGGVFLIDRSVKESLLKDTFHFRDRRAVNFDAMHLLRMAVRRPEESLALEKRDNAWRLVEPQASPAEKEAVDDFLYALEHMSASSVVSEHAAGTERRAHGLGAPYLDVELVEKRGEGERTTDVLFGKEDDKLYALRDWDQALLEIESPSWEKLDVSFDALRRKRLFTLPKWEVSRVEVKNPEGSYVLAKEDWTWRVLEPEGEKDPDRMQADDVISTITHLRASGFSPVPEDEAPLGLDEPFLQLRAGSDERSESASFGRGPEDGRVYARVEGWDDTLLVVEESSLEILLKPYAYLLEPTPEHEKLSEELMKH
ncbi:MAG: DUF4340 domain-containing protein [Acidobacteriota bacterium]|nr:MAG: DUF4340 domain-containing protein [Acidobacteriota bacterium]